MVCCDTSFWVMLDVEKRFFFLDEWMWKNLVAFFACMEVIGSGIRLVTVKNLY